MLSYRDSVDGLGVDDLGKGFFEGWPNPPSADTHLALLRGSTFVELALEDGKVIGFVTALSDGVLTAFIPLLEVLPEYRGRGIGIELTRRILARLDLYFVDLVCDANMFDFYKRQGFTPLSAMARRNYARIN